MLIFLHGSDIFRAKEKLDELKKRFLEKNNGNAFLVSTISGEDFNLAEFRNKVLSAGFFAEKKLIIFNFQFSIFNFQNEILEIIKKIPEEVVLVVCDKSEDDKSSKSDLKKYLLKQKYIFEFNPLSGNTLVAWIRERAKLYGCEIDNESVAEIIDVLGTDLWKIDLELNKLCAYASARDCHARPPAGGTGLAMTGEEGIAPVLSLRGGVLTDEAISRKPSVTKKIVHEMLAKEADENIFQFVDALATKNKRLALLTFENEINAGASELALLGAVSGQIRNLLQTKSLLEKSLYNKNDLAKKLNIHPYVAQKSLSQANNFHINELKNIYRQLLAIDIGVKTSSASPRALFSRMIGKI